MAVMESSSGDPPPDIASLSWLGETAADGFLYRPLELSLGEGISTVVIPVGFLFEERAILLGFPAEVVP